MCLTTEVQIERLWSSITEVRSNRGVGAKTAQIFRLTGRNIFEESTMSSYSIAAFILLLKCSGYYFNFNYSDSDLVFRAFHFSIDHQYYFCPSATTTKILAPTSVTSVPSPPFFLNKYR